MSNIQKGLYRHYKGNDYKVIDTVTHSETEETMVLYQPQYGDRGLWVRPIGMFFEEVEIEGEMVPRFQFIG